jgi:rare lipoprotein A
MMAALPIDRAGRSAHIRQSAGTRAFRYSLVFLLPILLLYLTTVSSVHAREPGKAGAVAASTQHLPHGKKKGVHKGLSGTASYYADRFHGRKTASGRPYFKEAKTAAHRSLPLGTWVRVSNERNGNSVVVQVTDRGPFSGNRVIDLSYAAAADLDMLHQGIAPVRLDVLPEFPPALPVDSLDNIQLAFGSQWASDAAW